MKEQNDRHPSYGMVGVSHVSSTGTRLVGTEFSHHHFVDLRIKRAEKHRDLSREWWFGHEELISIWLSEAQFVELMARPNMGDGVPCTISHVAGVRMDEPPAQSPIRDKFRKDFRDDAAKCVQNLESAQRELDDAIESGRIGKAVLRKISEQMQAAAAAISDGIPFVERQFEEKMEAVVNHAAAEIEATVTQIAIRLGVQQMREIAQGAPKMIDAPGDGE